jgi:hypothetical protein
MNNKVSIYLPKMKYSVRLLSNYEDKEINKCRKKEHIQAHRENLPCHKQGQAGFQNYGKNGKTRCPQVSRSEIR